MKGEASAVRRRAETQMNFTKAKGKKKHSMKGVKNG
jgi:hypothetical protein